MPGWRSAVWRWLFWLGLGALWELASRRGVVSAVLLPAPSQIVASLLKLLALPDFYQDLGYSLGVFGGGLFLATCLGTLIGILGGAWPTAWRLLSPFLLVASALPKVALMPLFILWLGIGPKGGVALTALMAGFPIILSVYSGYQALEGELIEMARAFGARPPLLIFSLVLPGTLPYLFSGLKVGVNYAMVAVIIAEFFASGRGIGHRMLLYMSNFQVGQFFACLSLIAAFSLLCSTVIAHIERRLLHWRGSQ